MPTLEVRTVEITLTQWENILQYSLQNKLQSLGVGSLPETKCFLGSHNLIRHKRLDS
jgi:hypothetical protein